MGIKNQLESLLILLGINSGQIMRDKADKVREVLTRGATRQRVVMMILQRCKANHKNWIHAAIAQTQRVFEMPLQDARALVSEFTVEKTTI
jgi:hypothetical protein